MEVKVQDVIAPEHLKIYEKERETIWNQLIFTQNNITIINKILDFPFELFIAPGAATFWTLTSKAFFDSTILTLWTIIADSKGEFNLHRFHNKIMNNWRRIDIDTKVQKRLNEDLKKVGFSKRIEKLATEINEIRSHHIAHLDYETKIGIVNQVKYNMPLSRLNDALNTAYELFSILCFEQGHALHLWDYTPRPQSQIYKTDIDELLDCVAQNSHWFHSENPYLKDIRYKEFQQLPEEKQQVLLEWKTRLGIPFSFE